MFGYDEIGVTLSFNPLFLVIAFLLIGAYSFYVYRYTIPQVNTLQKIILVSLRTLALILLIFIFFEPIVNLAKNEILKPINLVFIDNSRSMKIEDGTNRINDVKEISERLSNYADELNLNFNLFGNYSRKISIDSLSSIQFSDGVTDIADVFDKIEKEKNNYSSITLITDGVFTAGNNPYYSATQLGIPVFTIGIGDTTKRKDVEIKKVLYNEIIYAETPTSIVASIQNKGFGGEKVTASFYEDGKLISQQQIELSKTGAQNVSFNYTPESGGEKKLSVVVSKLKNEFTEANNKKIFYVNVLTNKINVLLLASSPSSDLTFIKNSLLSVKNLSVNTLTQISSNTFLEKLDYSKIDSANILFLIGFPSQNTPEELLNSVQNKIGQKKIPYFLTLSPNINLNRLMALKNDLPFNINQSQNANDYKQVQPEINKDQINNPIIKHDAPNPVNAWNNLPPVLQPNVSFNPKPESKVLAQIKVNNKVINSPLIVFRNFSGRKSIAVLAKDLWRWKLQTARKKTELFDSFILNSVKWLNALEEQKNVAIKTSKKNYSQGETVEFSGQVFDETLNPVSNAEVKVKIKSGDNLYEEELQNVGPGLYEGSLQINETGDFRYSGEAMVDGTSLGKDQGSFNIGEVDLEMVDPVMNYNLLNLMASETGGEFYTPDNFEGIFKRLEELNKVSSKEKTITSEIKLWSDEWLLVIAILLFSLEWFLRKRIGML